MDTGESADIMNITKTILMVGLLALMAGTAGAEAVLSGPNALGLYFDGEAVTRDLTLANPGTVDVYLLFTDPTIAFINAWEAKVTITTGAVVTGVSLPIGTTAVMDGPAEWTTIMSAPMPCNALTKLAVFSVASGAEQNTFLYLGNVDNPSVVSDLPAVRLQDGSWSAVSVSSGDPTIPVATINSSTPNESTSWGELKSLFR